MIWDCENLGHLWVIGRCFCAACGEPICISSPGACGIPQQECMQFFWYKILK